MIWVERVETVDVMCGRLSLMAVCVAHSCRFFEETALVCVTDVSDGGKCSVIEHCERTGDGDLTSIPGGRLSWGTMGLSVSSLRSHTPYLVSHISLTQAWRKFVCT